MALVAQPGWQQAQPAQVTPGARQQAQHLEQGIVVVAGVGAVDEQPGVEMIGCQPEPIENRQAFGGLRGKQLQPVVGARKPLQSVQKRQCWSYNTTLSPGWRYGGSDMRGPLGFGFVRKPGTVTAGREDD